MQGLYELQVFRPAHFDRNNWDEYGYSFVPVPSMSQWRNIAVGGVAGREGHARG